MDHSARRRQPAPRRLRAPLAWAVGLLGGLVLLGAIAYTALELSHNPRGSGDIQVSSTIGGPFRLIDQNGNIVTNTELQGRWLLVYFGYTHCPDTCPTALSNIALALRDLGAAKQQVRPVFITIDPERGTSQALKDYVSAFDAPLLALTGSAEAIAQAAAEYRVYYAKRPEPGGDYFMDHTAIIYVMNPKGRFVASFTPEDAPEQIAARLKLLLDLDKHGA
jgi:protein SCO1/2